MKHHFCPHMGKANIISRSKLMLSYSASFEEYANELCALQRSKATRKFEVFLDRCTDGQTQGKTKLNSVALII